jgi:hypothetical protein
MQTRGWVYVLTNRAMPGLVKVGFSSKDPTSRVSELSGTGVPHPFELEYDALVVNPHEIEKLVHRRLAPYREAKEFFRTEPRVAVFVIRDVVSAIPGQLIVESWRKEEVDGRGKTKVVDGFREKQVGASRLDKCAICGADADPSDGRCRQCFALLN